MAGAPSKAGSAVATAVTAPAAFNRSRRERSLSLDMSCSLAKRSICPDCIMWNMRVLVLGGTGLSGPFLVRRLYRLGHEVTVFHRGEHECELPAGVRRLRGDLHQPPD